MSIERIVDVNQDGFADFFEQGVRSLPWAHYFVGVTSGRDGAILTVSPPPSGSNITIDPRSLAAVGDMNQDGVPDYAVTVYDYLAPRTFQQLEVRSGATHLPLWTATIQDAWLNLYGLTIAGDLDLTGDGLPDLVTSATRLSPGGTIIAYDNSGVELYRIVDPLPGFLVGIDLEPLGGDLDGDGRDDFLSGGPEVTGRGGIVVFSGATGAVLRVSYGPVPSDNFQVVSKCGDMDHDGVLDYAAGALAGPNGVAAYSGATGLPIHIWRDPTMAPFGSNLEGGEDLDQDGVNDLVALGNEYLRVLSGRDGTVLYMFRDSRWPGFSGLGAGIALMPPPPGERYPLLVYSESAWFDPATNPGTNNINPGLIWTYRGNPPGVRAYGQPDAAAGLPLPRSGMRDLPGPGVRLTLSDAAPGAAALLVYGVSDTSISGQALPMPLDPFGLPGLTLLCSSDAATFALAGTTGMASGYAAADLAMPPGRSLATTGTPLFAQWLWVDPGDASRHGSTAGQRFLVR